MSLKTEFRVGMAMRTVAFGQDCKALIPREGLEPSFLLYAIEAKSPEILGLVDEAGHGTGRLNTDQLQAVEIGAPPQKEQRAIAEVLGALDDKIAANTRLATTADALASATYSSILDDGTKMPLSALADFVNGRAFTKDASGTGRVVIRIAELNSGLGGSTVYSDADVADQYLARPGDILFAWSGSLTLHRWHRPEAIINQHIFKVIPHPESPKWLVWQAIADRLAHFKGIAADKATTMGHIQRRHLDEPVRIPTRAVITKHDEAMTSFWDRALLAERENLALAATRDALLPALMSGKLRVRDAERLAADLT
jgi:type I restriction enzyme S subunit